MLLTQVFAYFFPMAWAVDSGCDYEQFVPLGKTFYVYSPDYPELYPANKTCRWNAFTTEGSKLMLDCETFDLPATTNCQQDKLSVSLTGDDQLNDAHYYCGKGNFNVVSEKNKMVIGFSSHSFSFGGRFLCRLTAQQDVNCNCGWRNTRRIVGGVTTGINEYPMMAGVVDANKRDVICGATIIASRYAVTAAHCIDRLELRATGLLVGDHDLSTGSDTSSAQLYPVAELKAHPNYDPGSWSNDIGIIRTANEIRFSLQVGPACLPFLYENSNLDGIAVTALGWGSTEFAGPKSETLQQVDLRVTTRGYCKQYFNSLLDSQICTYEPNKDSCQSDSGGPLLWQDNSYTKIQLIGVISYGVGCAGPRPGVNTRITSFLKWITDITPDASYCRAA